MTDNANLQDAESRKQSWQNSNQEISSMSHKGRIALQSFGFAMALAFVGILLSCCSDILIFSSLPLPSALLLFGAGTIIVSDKIDLFGASCLKPDFAIKTIAACCITCLVGTSLFFAAEQPAIQIAGLCLAAIGECVLLFFIFRITCSYEHRDQSSFVCSTFLFCGIFIFAGMCIPRAVLPIFEIALCAGAGIATLRQFIAAMPAQSAHHSVFVTREELDETFSIPALAFFTTGCTGFVWANALVALLCSGFIPAPTYAFVGLSLTAAAIFMLISRNIRPIFNEAFNLKSFAVFSFPLFVLFPFVSVGVRFAISFLSLTIFSAYDIVCLLAIAENCRFNQVPRKNAYSKSIPCFLLGTGLGVVFFTCIDQASTQEIFQIVTYLVYFAILIVTTYVFKSNYPEGGGTHLFSMISKISTPASTHVQRRATSKSEMPA